MVQSLLCLGDHTDRKNCHIVVAKFTMIPGNHPDKVVTEDNASPSIKSTEATVKISGHNMVLSVDQGSYDHCFTVFDNFLQSTG